MKQYTATANDDGVRLSRFVQSVTRDFPTSHRRQTRGLDNMGEKEEREC